ncbi:I78 family peptidase inhibitor [Mesorhizobium sp. M0276]|uniref:I78 family peptidase inhibitor n=1 Tax=Mesorhizobium sp. M0276 TaxID=2956928 RepID=UPI00333837AD
MLLKGLSPALVALALTACTPAPAPTVTAETGICNPEAAQRLVGRPRLTDDDAKRLTGAAIVRQIAPGQPVIQNYSNARLTVEPEPATGRIVRAVCG